MLGYLQREIYEVAISLSRKIGEKDQEYYFAAERAESFVKDASKNQNILTKATFIRDAIIAYNTIPNKDKRIEELKQELARIRPDIRSAMVPIEIGSIDIKKYVDEMNLRIKSTSLEECLIKWLSYFNAFSSHELLMQIAQKNDSFSFSDLFRMELIDEDGKVVYISQANTEEDRIQRKLFRTFHFGTSLCAKAYIENGIKSILKEHSFTLEDIQKIISDSPFIPAEHILIFSKAFYYFLKLDTLEAILLLTTQIENNLRHILLPYKNTDVIQADGRELSLISIEKLANSCEELNLLTKTEAFYLKTILVHPSCALRHEIAHGKVKDNIGNNIYGLTLCFLTFYLTLKHKINTYYMGES